MYCVFIKMNDVNIQKPILKWVGGKTQLMNNILSKIGFCILTSFI